MEHFGVFSDHETYTAIAIARRLGQTCDKSDPNRWVRENLINHGVPHRKVGNHIIFSGLHLRLWIEGTAEARCDDDEPEETPPRRRRST